MHELSIAENILDIVRQYVPPQELHSLRTVRIRIGAQAGIVVDSLQFSFEAITQNTPMAKAVLNVLTEPFAIRCESCGETSSPKDGSRSCPRCDSLDTTVLGGTEMQVLDLELDEDGEEGTSQ
jgi:hydrogenase nickel incorporation protein HypA/HybF